MLYREKSDLPFGDDDDKFFYSVRKNKKWPCSEQVKFYKTPKKWQKIIKKCLQIHKNDRYPNAVAAKKDLEWF